MQLPGRAAAAVLALAALQLPQSLRLGALDRGRRRPEFADHPVVEHADAAGRDRAHRQFLVARRAELADQEHVQGRAQRPRHLVPDRHAAARQRQYDHVVAAREVAEPPGQLPARFDPIPEHHGTPSE
jgi:hypothetical protein